MQDRKMILPPYNRTRFMRKLTPMAQVDFGIALPLGLAAIPEETSFSVTSGDAPH